MLAMFFRSYGPSLDCIIVWCNQLHFGVSHTGESPSTPSKGLMMAPRLRSESAHVELSDRTMVISHSVVNQGAEWELEKAVLAVIKRNATALVR